jgi:dTDP-4-amino-4,6-dideoxy-D-galactose acyltransferase
MSSRFPTVEPLPWDSQFLGFGVARVRVQQLVPASWQQVRHEAAALGCQLLYVVADPADVLSTNTLHAAGLARASCLVTFVAPAGRVAAGAERAAALHIERTTRPTAALEALAWESGVYSRFRLDPHLAPAVFQAMYREWLLKSLRGEEMAREVYSARLPDGAEVGLLTLGEQAGRADIGLLAVAADHRRAGIARQLLATAAARCHAWGLAKIQVVTQVENQPACRFYARAGFEPVLEQDIYHCWLR